MTGPHLPRIRAKTEQEKAADALRAQRQEVDRAARRRIGAAASDPATASPYDLLADALYEAVADAVFAAIMLPDFAAEMERRGYTVAPLCDGTPSPPEEWLNDGIDLIGADGVLVDPVGRLCDLWERAFQAGWTAHAAHPDTPTPD